MLIENELSKKYVEFSHRRKKKKINKIARSDLYNCKKFQDQKHNAFDQDIYIYKYKYILDLHTQCKHCSQ